MMAAYFANGGGGGSGDDERPKKKCAAAVATATADDDGGATTSSDSDGNDDSENDDTRHGRHKDEDDQETSSEEEGDENDEDEEESTLAAITAAAAKIARAASTTESNGISVPILAPPPPPKPPPPPATVPALSKTKGKGSFSSGISSLLQKNKKPASSLLQKKPRRPSSSLAAGSGSTSAGVGTGAASTAVANGGATSSGSGSGNLAPKVRIKLSMRQLPTLANRKPSLAGKKRRRKKKAPASSTGDVIGSPGDAIKATVLGSDEEVGKEDDAVAAVVASATPTPATAVAAASKSKASSSSAAGTAQTSSREKGSKRRTVNPTKALRMPLIASPGLFMVPPASTGVGGSSSSGLGGASDSKDGGGGGGKKGGYVTPASVFDHAMQQAGYTLQNRVEKPHRGSSVQRTVGDMFDSNYVLSSRFPRIVPVRWLSEQSEPSSNEASVPDRNARDNNTNDGEDRAKMDVEDKEKPSLPQLLIQSLNKKDEEKEEEGLIEPGMNGVHDFGSAGSRSYRNKKRKRPWQFSDMAPVSLSIPYPEDYLAKRVQYVRDVEERERAIVAYQEALEEAEIAQEREQDDDDNQGSSDKKPVKAENIEKSLLSMVPPIPEPPEPPKIRDLLTAQQQSSSVMMHDSTEYGYDNENTHAFSADKFEEERHPLYPPRGRDNFVAHLDPQCFHITEGRYFGLYTNTVADPNFVGPNAPGLSGVHASGGSGLATSTSGGGISGAMALALSTTYNGTTAGSIAAMKASTCDPGYNHHSPIKSLQHHNTDIEGIATHDLPSDNLEVTAAPASAKTSSSASRLGPRPTATSSDLKKIMDGEDQALAASMRDCIVKAAVHASRSGRHGQSFVGPDGNVYPDTSKSFAAHGGIKPCERCKSNKQGAYHCRLRRRHKQLDYDGGDSPGLLAPLFSAPMESLLCKQSSKNLF